LFDWPLWPIAATKQTEHLGRSNLNEIIGKCNTLETVTYFQKSLFFTIAKNKTINEKDFVIAVISSSFSNQIYDVV
jgi:hypothetical protein